MSKGNTKAQPKYNPSEKMKLFPANFIKSKFNATKAAELSGYSKKTARQQGSRLLSNVYIQKEIHKLFEQRQKRARMSAEDVIMEMEEIGSADITDYLDIETGNVLKTIKIGDEDIPIPVIEQSIKLKDSKHWKNTGAIQEISQMKDGTIKLKLFNKQIVLNDLGKYHNVIKDRHEHTGKDGKPIETNQTVTTIILPAKEPVDPKPEEKKG